jgi:hypothetical protein
MEMREHEVLSQRIDGVVRVSLLQAMAGQTYAVRLTRPITLRKSVLTLFFSSFDAF